MAKKNLGKLFGDYTCLHLFKRMKFRVFKTLNYMVHLQFVLIPSLPNYMLRFGLVFWVGFLGFRVIPPKPFGVWKPIGNRNGKV